MGRAPKYNEEALIDVVSELLPTGEQSWMSVAKHYQRITKEENLRSHQALKKHWMLHSCNKMIPTSGTITDKIARIDRCQLVQREIQEKIDGYTTRSDNYNEEDEEKTWDEEEDIQEDDYTSTSNNTTLRTTETINSTNMNTNYGYNLLESNIPTGTKKSNTSHIVNDCFANYRLMQNI